MGFQTCKYRKNANGEIESQLFDSDEIPEGWVDSPADLANGRDPVLSEEPPLPFTEPVKKKSKKKAKKRGD